MHGLGGRSSARVQVEGLALLHVVQDEVEVAVGKEDASPQKMVNCKTASVLLEGCTVLKTKIWYNVGSPNALSPNDISPKWH
jgi:hypothetical protein